MLGFRRIRGDDHKRGAVEDVRQHTVKTIRPQRAINAGRAHIVNNNEIVFVAKEVKDSDGPVVFVAEFVIGNFFWWRLAAEFVQVLLFGKNFFFKLGNLSSKINSRHGFLLWRP